MIKLKRNPLTPTVVCCHRYGYSYKTSCAKPG